MLVNIYGSKELFVHEYRVMLAHKLLSTLDFDTDREVHNLELLKLRFGEQSMRSCEIMIKDLDDSKRINANVRSTVKNRERERRKRRGEAADGDADGRMRDVDEKEEVDEAEGKGEGEGEGGPVVDAAIVSHIFWPALQKEPLTHHPRIRSRLDEFGLEYAKLKNPRRLVWLDQLGTVTLELEILEEDDEDGDGGATKSVVREFTCTPLQATLVSHFEDRDNWTAVELAEEVGVPEEVVRKRMGLFVNGGFVRAVRGGAGAGGVEGTLRYELASADEAADRAEGGGEANGRAAAAAGAAAHHHDDMDDEEDGDGAGGGAGAGVSSAAQEAEETAAYESYVVGMLTNLGPMPLECVHDTLKMYATGSDHRYDRTPRQLAELLRGMCRRGRIEAGADGMYKLVKK